MTFAPVFQRPFPATFDRHAAAAGNGLLTALIAYWKMDEASGDALDAHTNGMTLTDTNTVTNAAGVVYATARRFTAANTEYFARSGDDALLSTGDVDFTFACWCYFETHNSAGLVTKYTLANQREYFLLYDNSLQRLQFLVSPNGSNPRAEVSANSHGRPALSAWILVLGWHDSVLNTINIQVNDGTVDSTSHTTGVHDGTSALRVGYDVSVDYRMNGRIGPIAFWKSAAGAGGVLSAAQRTALYNGGAGLAYSAFTA